jgi:hypothetical protein
LFLFFLGSKKKTVQAKKYMKKMNASLRENNKRGLANIRGHQRRVEQSPGIGQGMGGVAPKMSLADSMAMVVDDSDGSSMDIGDSDVDNNVNGLPF